MIIEGSIAQWLAYLLPDPTALGSNHGSGYYSEKKVINGAVLIVSSALLRVRVYSAKSFIFYQLVSGKPYCQKTSYMKKSGAYTIKDLQIRNS